MTRIVSALGLAAALLTMAGIVCYLVYAVAAGLAS